MGQKSFTYFHRVVFLVTDFLVVNAAFVIASIYYPLTSGSFQAGGLGLKFLVFFNLTWLLAGASMRLYSTKTFDRIEFVYRQTTKTVAIQCVLFTSVVWLTQVPLHATPFIACYGILTLLVAISRFCFTYISEYIIQAKLHKKIAIVGYNETGVELARYFQGNNNIYTFAGFFDNGTDYLSINEEGNIVGSIEECIDFAREKNIQEIYSTIMPGQHEDVTRLVEFADRNCVRIKFVPAATEAANLNDNYKIHYLGNLQVGSLQFEPLQELRNRVKKRIFDILFSSFVIIFVLSWLMPLIGLIIKLESRGPVFFRQNRAGRDNKTFKIFKFRTMTVTEADGEYKQATKNDNRITKVGKFLRKTSLDELPQFLNVFIGDMSVTGPRPHPLKLNEAYMTRIDSYMARHFVKPGISGWAQVNGYRGETETPEIMRKRIEHDLWYVENWSTMLDIRIIVMTIINVIRGEEQAY